MVPVTQGVQLEAPDVSLKVPKLHCVQDVKGGVEKEPAGHGKHDAPPIVDANLPGLHAVQVEEFVAKGVLEKEPAGHASQPIEVLPATALKLPRGHDSHVVADVAPMAFENVPAGHKEQTGWPLLALKAPGGQG